MSCFPKSAIATSYSLLNACLCRVPAADTGAVPALPQLSEPGVAVSGVPLPGIGEGRPSGATPEAPRRPDQAEGPSDGQAAWPGDRSEATVTPASGPDSLSGWVGHGGAVQDAAGPDSGGPSPQRGPSGDLREGSGEGGVPGDEAGECTPMRPLPTVPQAGPAVYRVDSWDNYAGLMDGTPPPGRGGAPRLGPAAGGTALGLPVGTGEDLQPKFVLLSDDERAESTPTTDILPTPRLGWGPGPSPSLSWDDKPLGAASPLPPPHGAALLGTPEASGAEPVPRASGDGAGPGHVTGRDALSDAGDLLWSPGRGSRSGRVVELGEEEVVVPLSVLEAAQDGLLTAAQALAGDQQPVPQLGSHEEPHLVRVAAAVDIFEKVGRVLDCVPHPGSRDCLAPDFQAGWPLPLLMLQTNTTLARTCQSNCLPARSRPSHTCFCLSL